MYFISKLSTLCTSEDMLDDNSSCMADDMLGDNIVLGILFHDGKKHFVKQSDFVAMIHPITMSSITCIICRHGDLQITFRHRSDRLRSQYETIMSQFPDINERFIKTDLSTCDVQKWIFQWYSGSIVADSLQEMVL